MRNLNDREVAAILCGLETLRDLTRTAERQFESRQLGGPLNVCGHFVDHGCGQTEPGGTMILAPSLGSDELTQLAKVIRLGGATVMHEELFS